MARSKKEDDDSLHLLLTGGRLSGAQRDRILDDVLQASSPPRWRLPLRWLAAGLVPVAATAAIIIFATRRPEIGHDPTAKGGNAGALLQASCPGRQPGRCHRGDKLVFEVDGAGQGGLLAAYAERPSGERIWYFPTADGHLAVIPAGPGHAIAGDGVRIGDEHAPGPYTLHLVALDRATPGAGLREALVAGRAEARATAVVPMGILP